MANVTKNYAISLSIQDRLFGSIDKTSKLFLSALNVEHRKLSNTGDTGFKYVGMNWGSNPNAPWLHDSLHEKANKFIEDMENVTVAKQVVSHYVRRALSETDNLESLLQLFPEPLHSNIQAYSAYFNTIKPPMSGEEVSAFLVKNKTEIDMVKELIFRELLG